jgi:hypothetical protein
VTEIERQWLAETVLEALNGAQGMRGELLP